MGRNPPRNKKRQFVSYKSIKTARYLDDAGESSKRIKERILVDSSSDDLKQDFDAYKGEMQSRQVSGSRKDAGKKKTTSVVQLNSDSSDDDYNSEDFETMLTDLDETFEEAKKLICNDLVGDLVKDKETIEEGLEWLYSEVLDWKVSHSSKKGKHVSKKK